MFNVYFCVANKLAITNTLFRKNKSMLITFLSGGNHTQIDFILVKRAQLKNIKDTKVFISKECIMQDKLLVWDLVVSAKPVQPIRIWTRKKTWKLKTTVVQEKKLNKLRQWNSNRFPQKWRAFGHMSKLYFSKLQMKYMDELKVGVHGTKKPGGGIMRWAMQ